ncbi:phage tail protein [Sorangium sp. So ce1389]|uniref:phage tail protein n=1 Tax=Sorangium sp. So ce1389 TaxID=3133336 RepID=UPI003F613F86
MDANGLRFFLLADAGDLREPRARVAYDAARRRLRLASARSGPDPAAIPGEEAEALLARVPGAIDPFGTSAGWDAAEGRVAARGAVPGAAPVFVMPGAGSPPLAAAPTDVCLGDGGVVAIAHRGGVVLVDVNERFAPTRLPPPDGFTAFRLSALPSQGFVALDRERGQLARVVGTPRPDLPPEAYSARVFRPSPENPDPPRWVAIDPPPLRSGEALVAIAVSPAGDLAILSWDGERTWLRARMAGVEAWDLVRGAHGELQGPFALRAAVPEEGAEREVPRAFSLAFLGADRLAVLAPGLLGGAHGHTEALVYAWPPAPIATSADLPLLVPLGDYYPLPAHDGGPFLRGPGGRAAYPTAAGPRPVHPLSKKGMATSGHVAARPLDSRSAATVWHRAYLEAAIPDGTGVRLWLAASDQDAPDSATAWFPHDFGHVPTGGGAAAPRDVPRGAFVHERSEIPFEAGLLGCAPVPERVGLFSVLVQRAGRRVRALRGRFLHVRVELFGTGLATPEIAAIRIYAPRFSYVDEYLPELYAETVFGSDADEAAPATGADFLGRLLALVEGEMTSLEDRVAQAYLLTDPRKAPGEVLAWLASWVGLALDPAWPEDRRRALLALAPELSRRHGTLHGLRLALDAVTDGGVRDGKIVIIEEFRLRRVLATILGTHLEDDRDPLLPGLVVSGNSYVGDTLFLGQGNATELAEIAALYRADLDEDDGGDGAPRDGAAPSPEDAALSALYDRVAHRTTVLVHDDVTPQRLDWIERAVRLEAPAHVEVRVVKASWPFLVGVASLVGVDSHLRPARGLAGFRLDESALGAGDVITRPASLDPRLEGQATEETA